MKQTVAMDMTHGPLLRKILLFSLPLMASNILQLLFNAADVVIVGRFAGYDSLAAVGSTTGVVSLVTNLLMGLSVGVNVQVARYLGQGQCEEEISRTVHTAVFTALAGGAALSGVGILASRMLLLSISTPVDIFDRTLLYLKIYFAGTPFVMLYNYGAAVLRAIGDTHRPLTYLFTSGVANVILNLFFVIVLDMNVAGVGLATVLSQGLSAALVLRCLMKGEEALRFSWRRMSMDWPTFRVLARIGLPAGIQSCLFSLSNVVIQGAINAYGSVIMAGYSAGFSIENFLYISMNAFHHAAQTFISQNVGAGRYDRVIRILRTCMICTIAVGVIQSGLIVAFSEELVSIYNTDPAVIEAGSRRLWTVATFYVIYGMADVLIGAIRGYGMPLAPVIINLLGTCLFRIVWIGLLDTSYHPVEYVYLSYPLSWAIILVALSGFWFWLCRREQDKSALRQQ